MIKKLFFVAAAVITLATSVNAQIVIERGDLPAVGDTFLYARDYSPAQELGGAADTAQTWDFSEISPVFFIDTLRYSSTVGHPATTSFPSADLLFKITLEGQGAQLGELDVMTEKSDTGLIILGFYGPGFAQISGGQTSFKYSPADTAMFIGTTLGDSSYMHTFTKVGVIFNFDGNEETADTIELNTYFDRSFEAFGSLTTPFKTYDVLKVNTMEVAQDSISGTKQATLPTDPDTVTKNPFRVDTTYYVEFYTKGIGQALMKVYTDPTFSIADSVDFVVGALANFNVTPATRTFVDTLNFVDNSTGSPATWAWDFGDGDTSNIQNEKHRYAAPGDYLVTLTVANDFGSNTRSKLVNVPDTTTTGIGTVTVLNEVVAYPNPAKQFVNIQPINTNLTDAIEVFDATGKMVLRQTTNNAAVIRLETSTLTNGVYIFNIYNNGNLTNRGKFTVQK